MNNCSMRVTRYRVGNPTQLLLLLLSLTFMSSCVQNRKIVFLSKDDVYKRDMKRDSVVRKYDMQITEYKIQPLDLLYIKVESLTPAEFDFITRLDAAQDNAGSSNPSLGGFVVDTKGDMEYPVIGKLRLEGLTVFEAQEVLREKLKSHLTSPSVRVRLLNFRFTVLGEVNGERQVISNNTRVTFMEAIGLAGGLTEYADRTKVKVVRQVGSKTEVFYVNLLEEKFVSSPYYYMQQNDVVIVPPLNQRPFRRYTIPNITLFFTAISAALLVISLTKK